MPEVPISPTPPGTDALFAPARPSPESAEHTASSHYSYWRCTFRVFMKNRMAVASVTLLAFLLCFTVIQPHLPGQKDPNHIHLDPATGRQIRNAPPGRDFLFGSNAIGQDLWARIWMGTRTSMLIGMAVASMRVFIGILAGALWGYARRADRVFTEVYNVLANIPTTIVMALFTYMLRPSIRAMVIAMTVLGWVPVSLFIRNQVLIIRDREYNLASRCLGTPAHRIITRNVLPYLVSVIMLQFALAIPQVIAGEVFLSYIGLGLPLHIPSLGNLVNEGRQLMMIRGLRYQLIYPSLILSILTVSFYIVGNAFSDAADPRTHT